jgi:glycosyltransferase involved in cell wall biosynthesis
VVPAFNEELLIEKTLSSIPTFVDKIVVIDDASLDRTAEIVLRFVEGDARALLIKHTENGGVGAAISTGYVWCRDNHIDIAVVMAGDGQMDPKDLPSLLEPVVSGSADYAKGNRFLADDAWHRIPKLRYLGNTVLSFLTRIASGYWHVGDSQAGYTALGRRALSLLPIEEIHPRYGMPNDFLVTLSIYSMRVIDVPVSPIYGIGEKSGIRIMPAIATYSFLLARLFARRLVAKYASQRETSRQFTLEQGGNIVDNVDQPN